MIPASARSIQHRLTCLRGYPARHPGNRLRLSGATVPAAARRTAAWQRELVRERVDALFDPEHARALAEQAIREQAEVKNHPPDLINVALKVLVRESLELPGFSTLDESAARIRAEVNAGMFARILARPAGRASWSHFREQVAHMAWVDSLGDSAGWLDGIAESKIADFAGEALSTSPGRKGGSRSPIAHFGRIFLAVPQDHFPLGSAPSGECGAGCRVVRPAAIGSQVSRRRTVSTISQEGSGPLTAPGQATARIERPSRCDARRR